MVFFFPPVGYGCHSGVLVMVEVVVVVAGGDGSWFFYFGFVFFSPLYNQLWLPWWFWRVEWWWKWLFIGFCGVFFIYIIFMSCLYYFR